MPVPSLDAPTASCLSPIGASSSPPTCTVPEAICYQQPQLPALTEQSFQEVDQAPTVPTPASTISALNACSGLFISVYYQARHEDNVAWKTKQEKKKVSVGGAPREGP